MSTAPDLILLAAAALVGLAAGAWLVFIAIGRRSAAEREAARASREPEVVQLAAERDAAREGERRHARALEEIQRELATLRTRLIDLSGERATLAGRVERLAALDEELLAARGETQKWREACQRAEQQATALGTRLQEQHAATQEKFALLESAREQFAASFKTLASEILEEKSKRFTEQNSTNLGQLLNPLREQLVDFRKVVHETYDKESRERQLLKHEIETLKTLNQRISEDAINLTRALKGDSRTQGAWGELVLERLLEASGLVKGREYETQISLRDDDGGRPRPDVIVHLPDKRDIVIDAKVSLTSYERYCAASEEAERAAHLRLHLDSVRGKVKELADRAYFDLAGLNTLDFVLMFVPVEAAYIEAVRADDALHAFALDRRVIIVTTSTLLATLRTVASLWRFEDRNRNAIEIADQAGKLYDKFVGFVGDLDKVKSGFAASQRALDDAYNKLSSGRGNLVSRVDTLRALGAKAAKSLDTKLVETATDVAVEIATDLAAVTAAQADARTSPSEIEEG